MAVLSKMSRHAKLYQRLRTKGYPWVVCEIGKNGMPEPRAGAFQFGVRYTLDGERMLETFKALDEAEAARRERDVRLYASKNAVAFPAAVAVPSNRITLADALTQYLSDKAAEGKDHKTISAYRLLSTNSPRHASANFHRVASLVLFNLETQKLVDCVESGFIRRGNNDLSPIGRFLDRIMNVSAQSLHFRYAKWNRVVNEHGNIEISLLKRFRNVG